MLAIEKIMAYRFIIVSQLIKYTVKSVQRELKSI